MISVKIEEALNEQINAELYSAYLYLSMSAYFESVNLQGFANWMRSQTQEELTHAMRIFDFVNKRGGKVTLKAIAEPAAKWESPLAVFEAAYKHEQFVTGRIDDLVNLSAREKDHATHNFLQWFVKEQAEEEASVNNIVQKLKVIKDTPGGLFLIDAELAKRASELST